MDTQSVDTKIECRPKQQTVQAVHLDSTHGLLLMGSNLANLWNRGQRVIKVVVAYAANSYETLTLGFDFLLLNAT